MYVCAFIPALQTRFFQRVRLPMKAAIVVFWDVQE